MLQSVNIVTHIIKNKHTVVLLNISPPFLPVLFVTLFRAFCKSPEFKNIYKLKLQQNE